MAGGYMGKLLFINLSKGELKDEPLDEKFCRDFIGGYGFGARIAYSRQKRGIDPLGPDNILGFTTGPLTGTDCALGPRYTVVVGKSPLTSGWGDANSGGDFGPYLKFAGYDGVFFTGISKMPVYLFIKDGKAELRDASHLWGKDAYETEHTLQKELGKKVQVACIGPSGEKLSLISCVINNLGRAPGRSGVGAVMGSKKLKAIAVTGKAKVPVADKEKLKEVARDTLKGMRKAAFWEVFHKYGTSGITAGSAHSGDSPVKNWGGVGIVDFPNAKAISDDAVQEFQEKPYGCYRCVLKCGGEMKAVTGEYQVEAGTHKPEYETLCMFGTNCLNDNLESIMRANDICNRYGLDTISAGACISFAIECYENGIITKEDTGGLEMTWGNHRALVAMTEKLAKREGFGDILADGIKAAAEKIGKSAEQYAIHIQGQEIPAHDPKLGYHFATTYRMDPTPGRHTQGGEGFVAPGLVPAYDATSFKGRGEAHARGSNFFQTVNCAGMCMFHYLCFANAQNVPDLLNAVTGWNLTIDDLVQIGQRIQNMRHAINLREGLNPLNYKVPKRLLGIPPQKEGPVASITVDEDTMIKEYLVAMDWDAKTAKPSEKSLLALGLNDVAKDLWS